MELTEAQSDLRRAFLNGGPGTVISGVVWVAAAGVQARAGVGAGFAVLFFGGMFIFPLTLLATRVFLGRAPESAENPLGRLVVESTIAMIAGLFAAWLFLSREPSLVMPLAAIAVGAHYFVFRTAYGLATFWVLGALLVGPGVAAAFGAVPPGASFAAAIGGLEIAFGLGLSLRARGREPALPEDEGTAAGGV